MLPSAGHDGISEALEIRFIVDEGQLSFEARADGPVRTDREFLNPLSPMILEALVDRFDIVQARTAISSSRGAAHERMNERRGVPDKAHVKELFAKLQESATPPSATSSSSCTSAWWSTWPAASPAAASCWTT